jgi:plasmid stabilization system protein ParE
MVYTVTWSPEALKDVEEIGEFLERSSARYASAVVSGLLDTARKLRRFPSSGRVVPEVGEQTLREKFAHGYRLIYRIVGQQVIIVAVIHGKRQFPFEIN